MPRDSDQAISRADAIAAGLAPPDELAAAAESTPAALRPVRPPPRWWGFWSRKPRCSKCNGRGYLDKIGPTERVIEWDPWIVLRVCDDCAGTGREIPAAPVRRPPRVKRRSEVLAYFPDRGRGGDQDGGD